MLRTSLWPRILRMAMPIVIAMLTQTAINIMDTVMVGWLDPSYSIAGQSALGFSLPMLWLVGGFLSSISIGTLAIVARREGEKDYKLAGAALTNALTIAVISSLVFGMLVYVFLPQIFRALIDNEAVLAFGIPYARYRLLGVLSMVTTAASKSFFDGTSKTYVHMVAAIVMNVANIGLNYVFIFGVGPFPFMNVPGAGFASLLSTYIGLAIMIAWTLIPALRKKYRYYKESDLSLKTSWDIIRVSVPSGLATIAVMSGFLLFFKIVGLLDENAIKNTITSVAVYAHITPADLQNFYRSVDAVNGYHALPSVDISLALLEAAPPIYSSSTKVIIDILSVTFMSAMAFGTATASLVSQSLGEKNPELAQQYAFESVKIAAILFIALAAFIFFKPLALPSLLSSDPEVVQTSAYILRYLSFVLVFISSALIFTQALFGAGNTKFVMVVELILHFFCLVPLAYILAVTADLGFIGVWIAAAVYAILLCLIMFAKFYAGGWKNIVL